MPTIGMGVDISTLIDAIVAGDTANTAHITADARELLERGAPAAELAGRVGMVAAHADPDGQAILTLNATAVLSRWVASLSQAIGEDQYSHLQELPLLVQALTATAPFVKAGLATHDTYPEPLFPSGLPEGKTVDDMMREAVDHNDALQVERLLFGLYGTGADYRTMQVRTYDGIATTFQNDGHPLIFAARGFQLLDAVEWGDRTPNILHWLAPHLPLHSPEPAWVETVRVFDGDPSHSLASLRVRLAAPRDVNALPLRSLILSDADTTAVCQGVYNALMQGGASSYGVGSVIALAAADLLQTIGDDDRDAFVHLAHGLLFAGAVRLAVKHIQDVAILPLLFTSAAYVNTLHKERTQQVNVPQPSLAPTSFYGSGLIPSTLLETLQQQLQAQDLPGTLATAGRYRRLGHDPRAIFATIALAASQTNAAADSGHTLQIVQAAGEEFMAWPAALSETNIDALLQTALRATIFAKR
ncbi:MAG TPA: hypothetical protein VKR83_11575 [Ktedonobacteraceae bacterium]|nr:hypothetical protein [Ktedonobacteraceae bacterium]